MKNPSLSLLLIVAFTSFLPSIAQAQYYVESPTQYIYGSTSYSTAVHSFQPVGQVVAMESNPVVWSSPYQTPIAPQIQNPILNESMNYAAPVNTFTPNYSPVPSASNFSVTPQAPAYSVPKKTYSAPPRPATQPHTSVCKTGG